MSIRIAMGLILILGINSCRTTYDNSGLKDPGEFVGLDEATPPPMMPPAFAEKTIICPSKEKMGADLLQKLQLHRIYGNASALEQAGDTAAARMLTFYQSSIQHPFNKFGQLTKDQIFDGSTALQGSVQFKPGDILLNMNYGSPDAAGQFYSKRGMVHTRMVIAVEPNQLRIIDGGWGGSNRNGLGSTMGSIDHLMVWLRPHYQDGSELTDADVANLQRMARFTGPRDYDYFLNDEIAPFRTALHQKIEELKQQGGGTRATSQDAVEFAHLQTQNKFKVEDYWAPGANPGAKFYCSEAATVMFSYLGFRQYGETPIQLVTRYSKKGNLVKWALFEDSFRGFGDNPILVSLAKSTYRFFEAFDEARKDPQGQQILGIPNEENGSWAQAIQFYLHKAMAAVQKSAGNRRICDNSDVVCDHLRQLNKENVAQAMKSELLGAGLTSQGIQAPSLTEALHKMYLNDLSYGPHHFMENKEHFKLQGVFHNPGRSHRWPSPHDPQYKLGATDSGECEIQESLF